MAFGPGEHEVRKLQSTGGSTFTVSLPKPWILEQQLKARDSLRVDWRPSGALRITPLILSGAQENNVSFDAELLPENSLHDHLMGAKLAEAKTSAMANLNDVAADAAMAAVASLAGIKTSSAQASKTASSIATKLAKQETN